MTNNFNFSFKVLIFNFILKVTFRHQKSRAKRILNQLKLSYFVYE